jgi:hypothetical protein
MHHHSNNGMEKLKDIRIKQVISHRRQLRAVQEGIVPHRPHGRPARIGYEKLVFRDGRDLERNLIFF